MTARNLLFCSALVLASWGQAQENVITVNAKKAGAEKAGESKTKAVKAKTAKAKADKA